ncbi:hypothetical protein CFP56_030989 [Quercus suber]
MICIIMVIYSSNNTLAFTRPGYDAWIDITSDPYFYDIAFYKEKFCAVDGKGEVFVCHIDDVRSKYKYKRVTVDNLSDQALFMGDNDYKKGFSSTLNGGWIDIGVFSIEDGNINQHYKGESYSYFSTPLWYI